MNSAPSERNLRVFPDTAQVLHAGRGCCMGLNWDYIPHRGPRAPGSRTLDLRSRLRHFLLLDGHPNKSQKRDKLRIYTAIAVRTPILSLRSSRRTILGDLIYVGCHVSFWLSEHISEALGCAQPWWTLSEELFGQSPWPRAVPRPRVLPMCHAAQTSQRYTLSSTPDSCRRTSAAVSASL